MGAVARRPRPSFRALLFGCGAGAVLGQTASFLVGSESNVRQWGLWPAGAVLGQTANFLVSSESNVRQWGLWPAGPVRPSGPCCLAVAQAPFWVRQLIFL